MASITQKKNGPKMEPVRVTHNCVHKSDQSQFRNVPSAWNQDYLDLVNIIALLSVCQKV